MTTFKIIPLNYTAFAPMRNWIAFVIAAGIFTMIELWKPVKGYEGVYEVSFIGRVRSSYKAGKSLKGSPNNNGYPIVSLYINGARKEKTIHRLMAIAFLPNPQNKPFINHKDGIKTNMRISNFEWCDLLYNNAHAKENKLTASGEKNGHAKLKIEQVLEIKKLFLTMTDTAIAKIYNMSRSNISHIRRGETWVDISITTHGNINV